MTLPVVLGSRAEAACRLLNQTLGLHRMQAATLRDNGSRTRLAPPTFDGRQVQRQATLLRMISITEAFCADRLLELAEIEVAPSGSKIRHLMWDRASTSAVSTWSGIQNSYKNWFDIKPNWTRINQLTEVRNAIAHGLGQLTRVQLAHRDSTVGKMRQSTISLDGDRVVLEEINLHNVKRACVDLIADLDGLIQATTGDHS